MSYVAYSELPHIRTNWRVITREWRDVAHATAEHTPVGSAIYEASKDTPGDVGVALVGWYIDITTGTVAASPPADTSAAAQRAEIESIILEEWRAFDRPRFAHADSATRPIYTTIAKRTQYLFAALAVNDSDEALDALKAEARIALGDFAFSADMSAWAAAFNGGSFYPFTKGTVEDSVALPAASDAITAPSVSQVNAVSLAARLA